MANKIMSSPLVTILVPNYKTLTLTKLCLRLLRKYTAHEQAKVIVIDNDSQDASLDYLRSLSWIQLIERQAIPGETPVQSHARALDQGLQYVDTPYVLSIHTDTLVKHPEWLSFLMAEIERHPQIAGVGSWKLEMKPWWRQGLKFIEHHAQRFYFRLIGKTQHGLAGVGKNYYYLRSHCAMYRHDLLKKHQLHFAAGDMVAGKEMHRSLMQHGYHLTFLSSERLSRYVEHVNHATTVLNPSLSTRKKSVDKGMRRIEKSLARFQAALILQDDGLDG